MRVLPSSETRTVKGDRAITPVSTITGFGHKPHTTSDTNNASTNQGRDRRSKCRLPGVGPDAHGAADFASDDDGDDMSAWQ